MTIWRESQLFELHHPGIFRSWEETFKGDIPGVRRDIISKLADIWFRASPSSLSGLYQFQQAKNTGSFFIRIKSTEKIQESSRIIYLPGKPWIRRYMTNRILLQQWHDYTSYQWPKMTKRKSFLVTQLL